MNSEYCTRIENLSAGLEQKQSSILSNLAETKEKSEKNWRIYQEMEKELQIVRGELLMECAKSIKQDVDNKLLRKNSQQMRTPRKTVPARFEEFKQQEPEKNNFLQEAEIQVLQKQLEHKTEEANFLSKENKILKLEINKSSKNLKKQKSEAAQKFEADNLAETLADDKAIIASLQLKVKQLDAELVNNKETIAGLLEENFNKSQKAEYTENTFNPHTEIQAELQRQLNDLNKKHAKIIEIHARETADYEKKLQVAEELKLQIKENEEEKLRLQNQIAELVKANQELSQDKVSRKLKEMDSEILRIQEILRQQMAANNQLVNSYKEMEATLEEEKKTSKETIDRLELKIELLEFENEKLNQKSTKEKQEAEQTAD